MGIFMNIARRVGGALLARGRFVPAVTRVQNGQTIVVQPEIVEPKGILRSKTVWSAALSLLFAIGNANGWNLWFSEEQAQQILGWLSGGFAAGAIGSRIVATMPTRGPSMGP